MSDPKSLPCIEITDHIEGKLCHLTAEVIGRYTVGSVIFLQTRCLDGHIVDVDNYRVANISSIAVRPLADIMLQHFPVPDTVPESWPS